MRLSAAEVRALRLLEDHRELLLHRGNRWSHGVYNIAEYDARGAHFRTIASLRRKGLVDVAKLSNSRNTARLTRAGTAELIRRAAL